MRKYISVLFAVCSTVFFAFAWMLYGDKQKAIEGEMSRQQEDIDSLQQQLSNIPSGYIEGFNDSDTIFASNQRISQDIAYMNELWMVAMRWNTVEEYLTQRTAMIENYGVPVDAQFMSEVMTDTRADSILDGISSMNYLKQDPKLLSIKGDVYTYFTKINYYTGNSHSQTGYRNCYVICSIDGNRTVKDMQYYSSQGWE